MITREYYDENNQRLQPGSKSKVQHNSGRLEFTIFALLDSLEPELWRAEVRLFGHVIITVEEQYPTKMQAGHAAEHRLQQHLTAIFSATPAESPK